MMGGEGGKRGRGCTLSQLHAAGPAAMIKLARGYSIEPLPPTPYPSSQQRYAVLACYGTARPLFLKVFLIYRLH